MKKILAVLALFFLGWTVKAQSASSQSNMPDSTHRHHAYRNHDYFHGNDSLHQRKFNDFGHDRGQAMNRFGHHDGMNRSHAFGEHGFGDRRSHIHFSAEQRKQMQAINMDFHKKSTDLYKNDNLTLGQYKSQLLALQKEKKTKLQGLLTQDQKDQMAMSKKRREEDMQVRSAARLERMKIRLKLTDEQTARIKSQEQNMRAQVRSIRENENLMTYQKMEQIKSLAAKRRDEMKTVLTPEQVTQLENMHKQRNRGR